MAKDSFDDLDYSQLEEEAIHLSQVADMRTIRTQLNFVADDSFDDLDCSQLEEEAIHASQVADIRRNLVLDVFRSDDEDDSELEAASRS